ncbi:MAG: hypothetical protein JRI36_13880, partial [Deltaproteobacteria bacterium]|nr:hypothetical protein [Deltaproteobacteria bacterium]
MTRSVFHTHPRSTKRVVCLLVACLVFGASGCGYHFKGMGLKAPEGVQTIAVMVLENNTAEPGIETVFTGDLSYEFTRSKVLQVVNRAAADAVLSGSIVSLAEDTVTHTESYTSDERRVVVTLKLVLRRKDGKVVWANNSLSDEEVFSVSDDRATTDKNKREAIETLSTRLAEKV